MAEVAAALECSVNKVVYWMDKHGIERRSVSDAMYVKKNPDGDPFKVKRPQSREDWFLYGLGLGLYWGEGTKANKNAVRLGNTDPALIIQFIDFLEKMYSVDRSILRFGLQIFSDINEKEALDFWTKRLNVDENQFYKVTVSRSVSQGTYKKRNKYGVVTVYLNNTKLRNTLIEALQEIGYEG